MPRCVRAPRHLANDGKLAVPEELRMDGYF